MRRRSKSVVGRVDTKQKEMVEPRVSLIIEPHHLSTDQDRARMLDSIESQDHKNLEILCYCPSALIEPLIGSHKQLRSMQFIDYKFTHRGQFWESIIARSTGSFIGVMDPRYVLSPDSISSRLKALLIEEKQGWATCEIPQMDDEGNPLHLYSQAHSHKESDTIHDEDKDPVNIVRAVEYIDTHSVLVKRNILSEGLQNTTHTIKHDMELWLTLLRQTSPIHLNHQTIQIWLDPKNSIRYYLDYHQERIGGSLARYKFLDALSPESHYRVVLWDQIKGLLETYAAICYDSHEYDAWLRLFRALHELDDQQAQPLIAAFTWSLLEELDESQMHNTLLGMDESKTRGKLELVRSSRLWRLARFIRKLLH